MSCMSDLGLHYILFNQHVSVNLKNMQHNMECLFSKCVCLSYVCHSVIHSLILPKSIPLFSLKKAALNKTEAVNLSFFYYLQEIQGMAVI